MVNFTSKQKQNPWYTERNRGLGENPKPKTQTAIINYKELSYKPELRRKTQMNKRKNELMRSLKLVSVLKNKMGVRKRGKTILFYIEPEVSSKTQMIKRENASLKLIHSFTQMRIIIKPEVLKQNPDEQQGNTSLKLSYGSKMSHTNIFRFNPKPKQQESITRNCPVTKMNTRLQLSLCTKKQNVCKKEKKEKN